MKNKIINMMAAVLLGCGLFMAVGCGSNKSKQLDAAITAINKQFPQQVAEGATLEGFFDTDSVIDIAVTLREEQLATKVDSLRFSRMQEDLIVSFTLATRQDKNLRELFQLIHDNGKQLSLTITTVPSQRKQSIRITSEQLQQILTSESKSSAEMAQLQLDQFIRSQEQLLPLKQGPVTCTRVYRDDNSIVWEYVADESLIDLNLMESSADALKSDILTALAAPDGLGVIRTALDADCSIVYIYKGDRSDTAFSIELSQKEMKEVQRNSVSTKLQ